MKVLKREISLNQCHKNVTSTKLNPFGPAISERSLPEFKKEWLVTSLTANLGSRC